MIISPQRRYIFVHLPKTGGTSLSLALEEKAAKDDVLVGDTPKAKRRRARVKALPTKAPLQKHSGLADLDGWIGAEALKEYLVFTIVRNPWDRMVSYYHWLRAQSFNHPAVQLANTLPFDTFLLHPQTRASFTQNPVRSYLTDAAGQEQPAFIIRFEDLDNGVAQLSGKIGLNLGPLKSANQSARAREFRTYYTDTTRAAVQEYCAEDIDRFGYGFE